MSARIKVARAARSGDPGRRMRSMPGVGYVQGDPGLFGLIPGVIGLAGKVIKAVKGTKPAQPSVSDAVARQQAMGYNAAQRLAMGASRDLKTGRVGAIPEGRLPTPGVLGGIQRLLPGGATGYEQRSSAVPVDQGPPAPGYHLNKSGYWLKSGQYIPPRSVWVKNRRRNPFNPRAIDRAIGRIESGKRAAKRLGRITVRKKCAVA